MGIVVLYTNTSGTATLEGAISNTPLAVVYKTSWLSWIIARLFLRVPFISIINILNKTKLVEEFLQHEANPKNIASYIIKHIENPQSGAFDYSSIRAVLYQQNIYQNAALEIIN